MTEREARLTMKARDEALQRKVAEAAKARKMAEGVVVELRASLGVLETTRVAALSKLSKSQQLISGAFSLFLLSHASMVGSPIPSRHEPCPPLLHGIG